MDKVAAQLAGSLARQRDRTRSNLTFEQLQAKFPTEGKFGIQTSRVEKSIDTQGNVTHVLTQTAADGSGDTLRFTMLTDAKGRHYSVSDGVIKPITNARKDSHWQEAHFAALRGKAAKQPQLQPQQKLQSRDYYVRQAKQWALEQFGTPLNTNADASRVVKHDTEHMVVQHLLGANSKQIQKQYGHKTLSAEEGIVAAVTYHIDNPRQSIEAAISSGAQVSDIVRHTADKEEAADLVSASFRQKLAASVRQAIAHPDFKAAAKYLK